MTARMTLSSRDRTANAGRSETGLQGGQAVSVSEIVDTLRASPFQSDQTPATRLPRISFVIEVDRPTPETGLLGRLRQVFPGVPMTLQTLIRDDEEPRLFRLIFDDVRVSPDCPSLACLAFELELELGVARVGLEQRLN